MDEFTQVNVLTAMKQAREVLENLQGGCTDSNDGTVEAITVWCPEVIADLDAAIEQAAQAKPVAWMDDFGNAFPLAAVKGAGSWINDHQRNWKPLYAAPVTITEDDLRAVLDYGRAVAPMERALKAEAEVEKLKLDAGLLRLCVTCGKVRDASITKDEPGCDPSEYGHLCLFDATPMEAFLHWRQVAHAGAAELFALRAEVEALRKDAARYRWLRHGDNDEECLRAGGDGNVWLLRNDDLDDVIDAAMAREK